MLYELFLGKLKAKNTALFLGFAFVCIQANSQFYVSENTVVNLNEDLVSQEQIHLINSSITGNAALVFNSEFPQQLISNQHIEIPYISVRNASEFVFDASLSISGDLSIHSSNIIVLKETLVLGQFLIDDGSHIVGHNLILDSPRVSPKPLPINKHQNHIKLLTSSFVANNNSPDAHLLYHHRLAINYKDTKILPITLPIPTPPPERLDKV